MLPPCGRIPRTLEGVSLTTRPGLFDQPGEAVFGPVNLEVQVRRRFDERAEDGIESRERPRRL